ncbi:MAG: nitrate/nitrite transporter NrtS [Thiohalocapsa sp.]
MDRSRLQLAWHYASSGGVPRRAFWVAVVVGTILNLINQGDAIVTAGPVNVVKLLLTYAVPYCVATYGAVSFRLHSASAELASAGSSRLSDR